MVELDGSEVLNDPLFLGGIEELPMNLINQDIDDTIDIDDLFSIFDDELHTPSDTRISLSTGRSATPTTSESGNGNVQARSPEKEETTNIRAEDRVAEEKRLARMKRNRENAHLSRLRKKQQLLNLQQSCQNLKHQNSQLNLFIQRLAAENCLLRHHLNDVCKNADFAVPSVPSVLAPSGKVETSGHEGYHAANKKSKVIHEDENKKTNPAREDAKVGESFPVRVEEKRSCKGRKIGGAGAAFLTLFSIFLFVGPIGINPNHTSSSEYPKLLPEGHLTSTQALTSTKGRGLMSVNEATSDINLSEYLSETVNALLQDQKNDELPNHALSSLEDIAPHALILDKDDDISNDGGGSLPAASVFPALAKRFFESSGLEAPQMCTKVFTFHSDGIPSQFLSRNKKSIEKYVMGTHGFKGRSSGLKFNEKKKTPTRSLDVFTDDNEASRYKEEEETLLPTEVSEPHIVSVMLPANASRSSRSGITAIDHLYVVILDPENTFSTYACQLPKSLVI